MRKVAQNHPEDADAQVLFAEALMNLRPWDHWTQDGRPQPGTEEIVTTLERALRKWPNHPGANHYYIHTVEASPDPGRALAAADRLGGLMPGAGHLVHMPAHIYERTGRYADGVRANEKGIVADEKFIAARGSDGVYPLMYYNHNIHFLWAGLSDVGKSREAIARARQVSGRVSPDMVTMMPMIEFIPPTTYYAYARFGAWDSLLALPKPPETMRYTNGMWHYGRGLALAAKGRFDEAAAARDSVDEIADALPEDLVVGLNTARPILRVAAALLAGDIDYRAKKYDDGDRPLRGRGQEGRRAQVRRAAGVVPAAAALPRQGAARRGGARPTPRKVYRADLLHHPNLGWTLMGLTQALEAAGQDARGGHRARRVREGVGGRGREAHGFEVLALVGAPRRARLVHGHRGQSGSEGLRRSQIQRATCSEVGLSRPSTSFSERWSSASRSGSNAVAMSRSP
jgi:tetratricopeptide (TPR) repeat protein